ncbi:MAG: Ig-like domain-containing protein [Dehalococcoidales bacterium]|nr:Ig-like domain-containing protein [Dehalococcoidales bacterium]
MTNHSYRIWLYVLLTAVIVFTLCPNYTSAGLSNVEAADESLPCCMNTGDSPPAAASMTSLYGKTSSAIDTAGPDKQSSDSAFDVLSSGTDGEGEVANESSNYWSYVSSPQVTVGTDANVFCIAADGQTMWLYTDGTIDIEAEAYTLYKSTDGGINWSRIQQDDLGDVELTQMVVSQYNADYLLATDGTNVWYSEDGGDDWYDIENPGLGPVNCVDITEDDDGDAACLIACEEGLALYDREIFRSWVDTDDELTGGWDGGHVLAAGFSPSYPDDLTVVTVVAGSDYVETRTLIVGEGAQWNEGVAPAVISDEDTAAHACIEFPSDYLYSSFTYNKYWVGLGDPDDDWENLRGLYYINGRSTTSRVYEQIDYNVSSMSYRGTCFSGTLAMGLYNYNNIIISDNAFSSSSFDYIESDEYKSPTGNLDIDTGEHQGSTLVRFSPAEDALFAGTCGEASGLFVATDKDYCIFNGLAFIEVESFDNVELQGGTGLGGETMYQVMNDGKMAMVFRSTDSGSSWEEVFNTLLFIAFYDNDFDEDPDYESYGITALLGPTTDGTLYIQIKASSPAGPPVAYRKFARSYDGGDTWCVLSSPGNTPITALSPIDATTYWFGSDKGVRRSDYSRYADIDGNTPVMIVPFPGFFVCVTDRDIYISVDEGETFDRLGYKNYFRSVPVFTLDFFTKTVYAVDGYTGDIIKWSCGEDLGWSGVLENWELPEELTASENGPEGGISSLVYGQNGCWYITSTGNENGQVWRSTELNGDFEAMPYTSPVSFRGLISDSPGLSITIDKYGNTLLFAMVHLDDEYPAAPNYYPYRILCYEMESNAEATVIGVALQGGSRPESGWGVPLTVGFFDPGSDVLTETPLYQFDLTAVKFCGIAVVQARGVEPGTYDISVAGPHCLTNVRCNVEITYPSVFVEMGTLIEGDVNGDDEINIQDFGIFRGSYGRLFWQEGFNEQADFDCNGKVNISDFGLLVANYGLSAPIELGGGCTDKVPPTVKATDPEDDETGVSLDVSITASFSEKLNADTVNGNTFVLCRDDTRIDGTVSCASKTATFDPYEDLWPGTLYTATLAAGIEDSKGNQMENAYSWNFTTIEAPEVQSVSPEDGTSDIPLNVTVRAVFSREMDDSTIDNTSFSLYEGSLPVDGEAEYFCYTAAVFTPDSNLKQNTEYTAKLTTAIKDDEGVPLEKEYSWSFTTGESITSVKIGSDTVSTGESFVIEVEIQNIIELAAYHVRISFDHSFLEIDENELYTSLDALGEVGGVVFPGIVVIQDNGDLFYIAESAINLASGDGYLARIPFIALENTGQSDIEFSPLYNKNKLFDYDQFEIPCIWENGSVTVNAP